MRNRILLALLALLIAGAFSAARAQNSPTTTRVKTAEEITPSWTYQGHWYGFVTCNRLQRQGNTVAPDQVKQCIEAGGTCILSAGGEQGPSRLDMGPKDKCEEYAAQQVLVTGRMTSSRYGTGPTADQAVEGLGAGGDRPASKFVGISLLTAKILPKEAPTGPVDTSRFTQSAQQ